MILKVLLPGIKIVNYIIKVHIASAPSILLNVIYTESGFPLFLGMITAWEAHTKDEGCFPTFRPDAPFVLVVKKVRFLFYRHIISQKYWVFEQAGASYFGDKDLIIVLQHLSKPVFHCFISFSRCER